MVDRELLGYFLEYEPEDIPTIEEVRECYWEDVSLFTYRDTKDFYLQTCDRMKFYSDEGKTFIQLSDNHTIHSIDIPDSYNEGEVDQIYWERVDEMCERFEEVTGVDLYLLGRSGRHVCVNYDIDNFINYDELCRIQTALEEELIDSFNRSI